MRGGEEMSSSKMTTTKISISLSFYQLVLSIAEVDIKVRSTSLFEMADWYPLPPLLAHFLEYESDFV
jgi:hypothetical protein